MPPQATGSVLWRSWARVIRGRLPVIGLPNADFLRHGPPPAYARGRGAVGGAEPWLQVHPGVDAWYAGRAGARRRACERRAADAGWQGPAEPTTPRLNARSSDFRSAVRWKRPPRGNLRGVATTTKEETAPRPPRPPLSIS